MMTISAVTFLAKSETFQLSLLINRFEASFNLGGAAFVSLMILFVNLSVKTIAYLLKKAMKKSKAR